MKPVLLPTLLLAFTTLFAQIDTTSAQSNGWLYGGKSKSVSYSNSKSLKPMHYVPLVQDPIYQSMSPRQKEAYSRQTVSQRQKMQRLQNRYTQALNSSYTTTSELSRLESQIMRLRQEMLTIAQQIIGSGE